ncbi:MAG: shikimate kinase [Candidatus Brocadiaceae bacterium]|nr:shikimate kinase [Candidatus Brocadiaceae bacterium]
MNIILVGFRGTGKTTIGKILAQRLHKKFVDSDERIERESGKTIKDIFAENGEKYFRKVETQIIKELSLLDDVIISTGGGVILKEENVKLLKKNGIIIFLHADADILYKRIRNDSETQQNRPKLTEHGEFEEISYLIAYRWQFYDRAADFILETTHISANQAADKISYLIKNHVKI